MEVPAEKVSEGMKLCCDNAWQFVEAADSAIVEGRLGIAFGLYLFGLEEVGKVKLLQEALENSNGEEVQVGRWFFDHDKKLQAALDLLNDPECRRFSGSFSPEDFSDDFDTGRPLTIKERLDMWVCQMGCNRPTLQEKGHL